MSSDIFVLIFLHVNAAFPRFNIQFVGRYMDTSPVAFPTENFTSERARLLSDSPSSAAVGVIVLQPAIFRKARLRYLGECRRTLSPSTPQA